MSRTVRIKRHGKMAEMLSSGSMQVPAEKYSLKFLEISSFCEFELQICPAKQYSESE